MPYCIVWLQMPSSLRQAPTCMPGQHAAAVLCVCTDADRWCPILEVWCQRAVAELANAGAGDIYPATVVETIIGLFIIAVGLVFFGLLLGSIASSLQV